MKDHKCITCNGIGEIAVLDSDIVVGCFDCDYDGKVTKAEYEAQIIYHKKLEEE
jgi:hypothetical protein